MAYTYSRTVTIDYTKCGSANSTDFPVLVSGTYSYLATVANGGKVQNASGYDVAFYSDSGLTTQLKHEVESYTATTGAVIYWVKVPTLSYTADTVIYMAYGDSGISTTQADPTNVWNSGYKLVTHNGDGSTVTLTDSTANAQNGTNSGATAVTGKVRGAISTNGSSTYADWGRITGLDGATYATYSAWIYRAATSDQMVFGRQDAYARFGIQWASGGILYVVVDDGGNSSYPSFTQNVTGWHHLQVAYDGTQGTAIDRIVATFDGTQQTLTAGGNDPPTTLPTLNSPWVAGRHIEGGTTRWGTGYYDEMHVSTGVARSVSWALAEYNNQNTPSTFYSVGSEVGGGAASPPRLVVPQTIAVMRASNY